MKRKREIESTEIRSAIEELSMLAKLKPGHDNNHEDALHIPTMIFISICNFVLQVSGLFFYVFCVLFLSIFNLVSSFWWY